LFNVVETFCACNFNFCFYFKQSKKEERKNEYERHNPETLNHSQKIVSQRTKVICKIVLWLIWNKDEANQWVNYYMQVLQRKIEEAIMATKRLKELLESRKLSPRDNSVQLNLELFSLYAHTYRCIYYTLHSLVDQSFHIQ